MRRVVKRGLSGVTEHFLTTCENVMFYGHFFNSLGGFYKFFYFEYEKLIQCSMFLINIVDLLTVPSVPVGYKTLCKILKNICRYYQLFKLVHTACADFFIGRIIFILNICVKRTSKHMMLSPLLKNKNIVKNQSENIDNNINLLLSAIFHVTNKSLQNNVFNTKQLNIEDILFIYIITSLNKKKNNQTKYELEVLLPYILLTYPTFLVYVTNVFFDGSKIDSSTIFTTLVFIKRSPHFGNLLVFVNNLIECNFFSITSLCNTSSDNTCLLKKNNSNLYFKNKSITNTRPT
ncbi:hypothetical protein AGLY_001246 [Aphis glycines]|uniref:Uncharacterized protein n=1 Tax=Aphis glycines TaxID=307491 RepID=A0A6G0U9R9_APHGL|nr:hypothetical protein AGLY_001246 [Aphis glycines]